MQTATQLVCFNRHTVQGFNAFLKFLSVCFGVERVDAGLDAGCHLHIICYTCMHMKNGGTQVMCELESGMGRCPLLQ